MKMIRKGEYDLVNISLMGFDPVTGRSYEECKREWDDYMKETETLYATTPWWNIKKQIEIRWRFVKLMAKQGAMI